MKKYLNKKNILYLIVFVIFVIAVSIVGSKHEYWADEAHAWLFARDASIYELFTKIAHSDGHPILWHLVIKSFQLIGLKYDNFNIISITFSSLGVFLLLFKSNFKWYIKLLLPFTFFIFYQYSVVARGYCLILPLFSLLAIIWDKRKEHYLLFTILLTLLINLEVYTFLFAGSIYLLEIVDYIKNRKKYKKDILFYLIVLFFVFLLTTIYVMPLPSNTFTAVESKMFVYGLSLSFVSSNFMDVSNVWNNAMDYILIIVISLAYIKEKKKKELFELLIMILPVFLFLSLMVSNRWHVGIVFLIFIFAIWIHKLVNNRIIIFLLLITSVVQITWSFKSSLYDYNESYAPAKEVAEFIKKYDYKKLKIFGFHFYESSINPYFKDNIFYNWEQKYAFFYWDKSNPFYMNARDGGMNFSAEDDIIAISAEEVPNVKSIKNTIKNQFNVYTFKGSTYFENEKYEDMTITLFVNKKIDSIGDKND